MLAENTDSYSRSLILSVAPMMDWTDRHCRAFHRLLAPQARLYTEMVHAQAVIHGDRERLLGYDQIEHPVALQLGGSDPNDLAKATQIAVQWGYDEINLNVGCPSDRVQAGRFGACLMKEPSLVADCIAAMRAASSVPVTVKCRLGVDEQEDYTAFLHFIDVVAATGCDTFIVHARKAWLQGLSPKENREIPPLRYEWVHQLKQQRPALSIIINGGLHEIDQIKQQLRLVDGVMLGRAAYHEPYRLHQCAHALFESPLLTRAELVRSFAPYVNAQLANGVALKYMVKHVLGLFHAQPGGRAFRQILSEGAHRADADWSLIESALAVTEPALQLPTAG